MAPVAYCTHPFRVVGFLCVNVVKIRLILFKLEVLRDHRPPPNSIIITITINLLLFLFQDSAYMLHAMLAKTAKHI